MMAPLLRHQSYCRTMTMEKGIRSLVTHDSDHHLWYGTLCCPLEINKGIRVYILEWHEVFNLYHASGI